MAYTKKNTKDIRQLIDSDIEARSLPRKEEEAESGNLEIFSLRLFEQDKERLTQHFRRKGLKLSQGLRMIIAEYMDQEGIR